MERVLITGIGTLSPMGLDAASTWQALLDGHSGIDTIAAFDPTPYPVRIAGEVRGFEPDTVVSRKDARRMDRGVLFAIAAADEAMADSGLEVSRPERVGVVVGSAIGGIGIVEQQQRVLMEKGPGRVSSTFLPNALVDIATKFGAIGRNFAVISACATGSHAIGEAADLIKRGSADAMIAGGTEACITPLVLAGFCQMQALAARNDDPAAASRPFDRGRSGFVVAEGAGIVVLESESHARARGAGTPLGDPAETQAIRQAFGAHADSLATSSTKSMTGHLFGAAGALEAIITALALRDQVIPPTINLEDPDPECDLDYVPLKSREARFDVAISNSMGLGGHNGAVVLRRVVP